MNRAAWVGATLLAVLLGIGGTAWPGVMAPSDGVPAADAIAERTSVTGSAAAQDDRSAGTGAVRETVVSPARLIVRTLLEGAPCAATLRYVATRGQQAPFVDLDPQRAVLHGGKAERAGVRTVHSAGEHGIVFAEPHGVSLLAQGGTAGAGVVQARVAPFLGEQTIVLDLGEPVCRVHVKVLGEDLGAPAPGARLEAIDAQHRVFWHGVTDAAGHAMAGLSPGCFVVRVAGGSDDPDACAVVGFAVQRGAQTRTVVLAVPEPERELSCDVVAEFDRVPGPPVVVVLQRVDGVRERLVVAIPALTPGHNHATVALPPGTWRALVVPQGVLRIRAGEVVVVPPAGDVPGLRLELAAAGMATLDLAGVPDDAWPVRVRYCDERDLDESLATRAFAGPLTWHHAPQRVGDWEGRAHLLVHHRNRCWLGTLPPFPLGGTVQVVVEPACLVRFLTSPESRADGGGPTLVLTGPDGTRVRAMRRRLVDRGSGREAAWCAEEPLPAGTWDVQMCDGAGGQFAHTTLRVEGPAAEVWL